MSTPAIQLDRRMAVKYLLDNRREALVVSGLGSPSYDVHAAGDHDSNYYLWGAMGAAALVGFGLSLTQTSRPVWVITGDGEQLMGLGGLATIGVAKPPNLVIIVIDNERFGETGMQTSHTGLGVDLAAVANAAGFDKTSTVRSAQQLTHLRSQLSVEHSGLQLHVIKVAATDAPRSLPSRDAVFIKNRFRSHLGLAPC